MQAAQDLGAAVQGDSDRAAVRYYTTDDGYTSMNPYLRNPDAYPDAERAALQGQADRTSDALAKLPPEPGTTYRGVSYPDGVLSNYDPGQVVTEHGFTSTSRDAAVAEGAFDGNTLMVITGRHGRDVAPFSQFASEAEILYDKGTTFMVTERAWNPRISKWVIILEEISS